MWSEISGTAFDGHARPWAMCGYGQTFDQRTLALRVSVSIDILFNSSGENEVRSTLWRLALLAVGAAGFEFVEAIGRERNHARPDQVHSDLADAVGRIDRELVAV
jgi:hypothetical protein